MSDIGVIPSFDKRLVSVNKDTLQLAPDVREVIALNIADLSTPEGAAVAAVAALHGGGGGALLEDPTDAGTYLIPSGSSLTEDPSDAGTYLL